MGNPLKRATQILLCLAALVGALAAPKGLVLCVGEGGHVAIETAVEITPCGVPLRAGNSFGAPPVEACTDTALVQTALRSSVDPELATPLAISEIVPLAAPLQAAPTFPRSPDRGFASQTLRAHRTIVLVV